MTNMRWKYFSQDRCLQFIDEIQSVVYWITSIGDMYHLHYSEDLFDLSNHDILDISEDLDYLKYAAESHYQKKTEYIV